MAKSGKDKPQAKGKGQAESRLEPLQGRLIDCLINIAQHYGNPRSIEALTSGLPVEADHEVGLNVFARAAERANLEAAIIDLPLDELEENLLPAVIVLKNKRACLIKAITADRFVEVYDFTNGSTHLIALSELNKVYSGKTILTKPASATKQQAEHSLNIDEKHKLRWFWQELWRYLPIYSEVLLASTFINLLTLASPLFIMNVYDRVVPNNAMETLWMLALGVFIAFSFDFLLRMLRTYFLDNSARNIDTRLSAIVFEHIMGIKMSARPQTVGGLVNVMHAFESFREFITSATITVIIDFPFVLLFVLFIWIVAGNVALVPFLMIPVMLGVSLIIQAPLIKLVKKSYEAASAKEATLFETIIGVSNIKTNNAQSRIQRKWEDIICYAAQIGVKLRFLSSLAVNFAVFAQYLGSVLVVIVGVYKISENELTVGALIASTILTGRALGPVAQLASLLMRYYQSVAGVKGLNDLMQLPVERPRNVKFLHKEKFEGQIEFDKVNFNYPNSVVPALTQVNFKIKPGEHIGIIGRVGSGKTTIEKLIAGLYEAQGGNIMLDGIDLRQYDPSDLRRNIGYVPQDIMLFNGTIRDNIVFRYPQASDEMVINAVKFSGLDQLIGQNPDGINMQVGERGGNLSGGQRQAIAISQAMLAGPDILLFDEPTISMDDISEARFRNNLKEILADKTLVLVTHKSSMLSLVGRIIILDNGRIVADGPRDAVLQALREKRIQGGK